MKIKLKSKTYDGVVSLINWIGQAPDAVDDYVIERITEQLMEMFEEDAVNSPAGLYALDVEDGELVALVQDPTTAKEYEVVVSRGTK